jgi:hypothetical protein
VGCHGGHYIPFGIFNISHWPNSFSQTIPECTGYPGIHSPEIKDWIVKQQVSALAFYSAYPEASVCEVWKALKTKKAFDALLDAAS